MENKRGLNSKYIQFFILAAVFLGFMFFSAPGGSGDSTRVYLLSGENDFFAVRSGVIVLTDQNIRFSGGDMVFRNPELLSEMLSYTVTTFFFDDGIRHDITGVGISLERLTQGGDFISQHMGSTMMGRDNWQCIDSVLNSLHSEVSIIFIDGRVYESILALHIFPFNLDD